MTTDTPNTLKSMGKTKLTDRQIRALLREKAAEDPDSWAAMAIDLADKARRNVKNASRGNVGKAAMEASKAEAFERQTLARYLEPEPKKPAKSKAAAQEASPTDTEALLREQLRDEHKDQPDADSDPVTEAQNAGEDNAESRSSPRARADRAPIPA